MKKYIFSLALLFSSCESVLCINGIVKDNDNIPLDSVIISDGIIRTHTDSAGKFKYMRVVGKNSHGEIQLLFSKKGYIEKYRGVNFNSKDSVFINLKKNDNK